MAEFFSKISQGVSSASSNVNGKVNDAQRKSQYKKEIGALSDKITLTQKQIGEAVLSAYKANEEMPDCERACREIVLCEKRIDNYNVALLALDNKRVCVSCGQTIGLTDCFCLHCGTKQTAINLDTLLD